MPTIRLPSLLPDNALVFPALTLAREPEPWLLALHDIGDTDLIAAHATLDRLASIVSRTICTFTARIASVVRRMLLCRAMNVARVANRRDARAGVCTPDTDHVHGGLPVDAMVAHDEKEAFKAPTFGITRPAANQQLTTARRCRMPSRMQDTTISLPFLRARSTGVMCGAKEAAGQQPESTVTLEHSAACHDHVSIQCNQVLKTVGRGALLIDDLPQHRDHLHQQRDHLTQQPDHLTQQPDHLNQQPHHLTQQCNHLQQRPGDEQHRPHKANTGPRWLVPARRQPTTPERSRATLLRRPDTHHAIICNSAPMTCNTPTMTCNAASMTCTAGSHHLRQTNDDVQHSNDQRQRASGHLPRCPAEEKRRATHLHH